MERLKLNKSNWKPTVQVKRMWQTYAEWKTALMTYGILEEEIPTLLYQATIDAFGNGWLKWGAIPTANVMLATIYQNAYNSYQISVDLKNTKMEDILKITKNRAYDKKGSITSKSNVITNTKNENTDTTKGTSEVDYGKNTVSDNLKGSGLLGDTDTGLMNRNDTTDSGVDKKNDDNTDTTNGSSDLTSDTTNDANSTDITTEEEQGQNILPNIDKLTSYLDWFKNYNPLSNFLTTMGRKLLGEQPPYSEEDKEYENNFETIFCNPLHKTVDNEVGLVISKEEYNAISIKDDGLFGSGGGVGGITSIAAGGGIVVDNTNITIPIVGLDPSVVLAIVTNILTNRLNSETNKGNITVNTEDIGTNTTNIGTNTTNIETNTTNIGTNTTNIGTNTTNIETNTDNKLDNVTGGDNIIIDYTDVRNPIINYNNTGAPWVFIGDCNIAYEGTIEGPSAELPFNLKPYGSYKLIPDNTIPGDAGRASGTFLEEVTIHVNIIGYAYLQRVIADNGEAYHAVIAFESTSISVSTNDLVDNTSGRTDMSMYIKYKVYGLPLTAQQKIIITANRKKLGLKNMLVKRGIK